MPLTIPQPDEAMKQKATKRLWQLLDAQGHPPMRKIRRYVQWGADITASDERGKSVLERTLERGYAHLAQYWLQQPLIIANKELLNRSFQQVILNPHWNCNIPEVMVRLVECGVTPRISVPTLPSNPLVFFRSDVECEPAATLIDLGVPVPPVTIKGFERQAGLGVERARVCLQRWKQAQEFAAAPDMSKVTPELVCALSNIGGLDVLGTPSLWRGHEDRLRDVLAQLPPYLSQEIIETMPQLMDALSAAKPRAALSDREYEGSMVASANKGR